MKVRDSGMPDQAVWESFFDPQDILRRLAFQDANDDVVDFGCGYGTFTLAAAAMTTGTVYALDIDPLMVQATAARAQAAGLKNVRAIKRDFVVLGSGLAGMAGYAMLFNILHAEDAVGLLRQACAALRSQGIVAVIHWVSDAPTPRGPDLNIRPTPEQCLQWMLAAGFESLGSVIALPPYHFGLLGRRSAA